MQLQNKGLFTKRPSPSTYPEPPLFIITNSWFIFFSKYNKAFLVSTLSANFFNKAPATSSSFSNITASDFHKSSKETFSSYKAFNNTSNSSFYYLNFSYK
mmetsp:Transcript_10115/g.906  ORF Transcript_10115/g.906 Transcript_10115/m.906 type:complete len:100 (+) Transcript_10115:265-564(+)